MEKSYGAVVYKIEDDSIRFLLVCHAQSNFWDFPKGHPFLNETYENTAIREVLEETRANIRLIKGFSETIEYSLPQGDEKQVLLYLAEFVDYDDNVIINSAEIKDIIWLTYNDAYNKLTFDNSKKILGEANKYLNRKEKMV